MAAFGTSVEGHENLINSETRSGLKFRMVNDDDDDDDDDDIKSMQQTSNTFF